VVLEEGLKAPTQDSIRLTRSAVRAESRISSIYTTYVPAEAEGFSGECMGARAKRDIPA
jgi:hypothetical protein